MIILKNKEKQSNEETEPVTATVIEPNLETGFNTIGLFGDVSEQASSNIIYSLLSLNNMLQNAEKENRFVNFYISTYGGSATDMFAIYDTMREVKNTMDIDTYGVGKVMSAGVLLLAAGTKGNRRIGKNCRVMIHSIMSGTHGSLPNLENEIKEAQWYQEKAISALIKETKMTRTILNKFMDKKIDIYLSAEEAVKYGIADKVV